MKSVRLMDAMSYGVGEFHLKRGEEQEVPDDGLFMRLVDLGIFAEQPAMASYHVRATPAWSGFLDLQTVNLGPHPKRVSRRIFSKLPMHDDRLERIYPGEIMAHEEGPFSVLVTRDMGAGDVLIATDLCYQIKRRYPQAEITFATLPQHRCLLAGNPDLASHAAVGEVDPFDFNLDIYLPRKSETAPDARTAVRTDIYLRECFGPGEPWDYRDHRTRLMITPEEIVDAFHLWEEVGAKPGGRRRLVIQPKGSGTHRSLDDRVIAELITAAQADDWAVAVVGHPEHWAQPSAPGFANLCGKTRDIRQVAAVIAGAALHVCPDSSGYHMAAALPKPVPAYALFTTVNPALRIRDYPNVRAGIGGPELLSCRPCADHISCNGRLECVRQNDGRALWEQARQWADEYPQTL